MMTLTHKKGLIYASLLCLFSCSEELYEENKLPSSNSLIFRVTALDGWNEQNRTRNSDSLSAPQSKSVEVGKTPDGEKLFIHVDVTDAVSSNEEAETFFTDKETATRGSALPTDDELDFGVFAYLTKSSETNPAYNATNASTFMDNICVDVSKGYSYSPLMYWPGSGYWLKFFAYRPYSDNVKGLTLSGRDAHQPILTYQVPTTISQQQDLLATSTDMMKGDAHSTVDFNFKHLLSAVRFKVGSIPETAKIKNISLTDIKNKGEYTIGAEGGMEQTSDATATTFERTFENGGISVSEIGDDGQIGETFYMIPQPLKGSSAKVDISITFDGNEYPISRDLKDFTDEWATNKIYTYTVSIPEEMNITVTDNVSENVKNNLVITNEGISPVYIRVAIEGYWEVNGTVVDAWKETDGTFSGLPGSGWTKGTDGYYYCTTSVARNATAPSLFESYTVTADAPYTDARLKLYIVAQAVICKDISAAIWPAEIVNLLTNQNP